MIEDQIIGDTLWSGVDEITNPASLSDGILSYGKNIRIDFGKVCTRGGHIRTPWSNLKTDSTSSIVAAGTVYGQLDYVNSDGVRYCVAFHATNASFMKAGSHRITYDYPSGVTLTKNVFAFQCNKEIRLMRGEDAYGVKLRPLKFTEENGWEFVDGTKDEQVITDTSYLYMPWGSFGLYYNDRVFVMHDNSLFPSNVGEFDIYDPVQEIPLGNDDTPTTAIQYDTSTIIVTRKKSICVISGVTGDLSSITVDKFEVIGCEAKGGILIDKGVVLLPTTRGLVSLSQVFESRKQVSSDPLSKPIGKTYGEINFSKFSGVVSAAIDGNYYFAVPSFDSAVNNRTLVYSITNSSWTGYDENPTGYDVAYFTNLYIGGKLTLCGLSSDGYIFIYAADESSLEDGSTTEIITRGYSLTTDKGQVAKDITIAIKTINPNYSVYYSLDGINETRTLTSGVEKENNTYTVIGKEDWDTTNTNLDFNNPFREDYSIFANDSGFVLDKASGTSSYIILGQGQSFKHSISSVRRDKFVQIKITNSSGYFELDACSANLNVVGKTYTKSKTL